MIRYLLILLMLIPIPSAAQENNLEYFYTKQQCMPRIEFLISTLEYEEKPLFMGVGLTVSATGAQVEGYMFFYVNQDSGTWVLATLYSDDMVCINALGYNFEPYIN